MSSNKSNTYEWMGTGSLNLTLSINNNQRSVVFPKGQEKPKLNARYTTEDPDVQAAIERCYLFKSGRIKLLTSKALTASATEATGNKKQNYMSVKTYQEAAAKLVEKYGASTDELSTPDDILKKAEEVGALFPNLVVDPLS